MFFKVLNHWLSTWETRPLHMLFLSLPVHSENVCVKLDLKCRLFWEKFKSYVFVTKFCKVTWNHQMTMLTTGFKHFLGPLQQTFQVLQYHPIPAILSHTNAFRVRVLPSACWNPRHIYTSTGGKVSQLTSRFSWNMFWHTHSFVHWKNWIPGGWWVIRTKLGMARMWGAESQMEQTHFI